MLQVYLDDSGKHTDFYNRHDIDAWTKPVLIAGGISSCKKWQRLELEWGQVLRRYKVKKGYHASHFFSGRKYEPYKRWSQRKRLRYYIALTKIVTKFVEQTVGCGVSLHVARQINDIQSVDDPHGNCLAQIFKTTASFIMTYRKNEHIQIFLDCDQNRLGQSQRTYNGFVASKYRGTSRFVGFDPYKRAIFTIPLQVADYITFRERFKFLNRSLPVEMEEAEKHLEKSKWNCKILDGRSYKTARAFLRSIQRLA